MPASYGCCHEATGETELCCIQLHSHVDSSKQHSIHIVSSLCLSLLVCQPQVVDFVTSITIHVYQDLIRKHYGMQPQLAAPSVTPAAFGSSAPREAATTISSTALEAAAAQQAANSRWLQAQGRRLLPFMEARLATRREPAQRKIPHVVVPGLPQLKDAYSGANTRRTGKDVDDGGLSEFGGWELSHVEADDRLQAWHLAIPPVSGGYHHVLAANDAGVAVQDHTQHTGTHDGSADADRPREGDDEEQPLYARTTEFPVFDAGQPVPEDSFDSSASSWDMD